MIRDALELRGRHRRQVLLLENLASALWMMTPFSFDLRLSCSRSEGVSILEAEEVGRFGCGEGDRLDVEGFADGIAKSPFNLGDLDRRNCILGCGSRLPR